MKQFIVLIALVVLLSSFSVQAANITTCAGGTSILCENATFSGNDIITDTQSITIQNSRISCGGTNGGVDQPGTGGNANIQTNSTLSIINSTIDCTGGNGGDNNCALPRNAGAGGGSDLVLRFGSLRLEDTMILINGGNAGNANCVCSGSPCGDTRDPGWSRIFLRGDTILNWTNVTIYSRTGSVGTGGSGVTGSNDTKIWIDVVNLTNNGFLNRRSVLSNVTVNQRSSRRGTGSTNSEFRLNMTDARSYFVFDRFQYSGEIPSSQNENFIWNVSSGVAFRNSSSMTFGSTDDGSTITHRINQFGPRPNYGIGFFDATISGTLRINTQNFSALFRGGSSDPTTVTLEGAVSAYNLSLTDFQFFRAVNNSFPAVTAMSYTPSPPVATSNVNCNFTAVDADSDGFTTTRYTWWHNNTINTTVGATFPSARLANGDTLICQLTLGDGFLNATIVNGSLVTLNDGDRPSINAFGINATSFTVDFQPRITANCTDGTSNIATLLTTIVKPNGNTQNFSLSFPAGSSVNGTLDYSQMDAVGTYNITQFWCSDAAGNSTSNGTAGVPLIQFTAASSSPSPTPSAGGGGGGGGGAVSGSIFLDFFGVTLLSDVFLRPSTTEFSTRFQNTGNGTLSVGQIIVSPELSKYVDASVCNIDRQECQKYFSVKPGETKVLKTVITESDSIIETIEGTVTIQDQQRNKNFEIVMTIGRPAGFTIIQYVNELTGVGLLLSGILVYGLLFIVVMLLIFLLSIL